MTIFLPILKIFLPHGVPTQHAIQAMQGSKALHISAEREIVLTGNLTGNLNAAVSAEHQLIQKSELKKKKSE